MFEHKIVSFLKAWNDFNEKLYKKRDFNRFTKDWLVVTEGHCHRRKNVQILKTCLFGTVVILQMRKYKILFFLVLAEPFSVEKTIFGTTYGLKISIENITSSNCSKSCNSVMTYGFSKQHTCVLPFLFPKAFLRNFSSSYITITHSPILTSRPF